MYQTCESYQGGRQNNGSSKFRGFLYCSLHTNQQPTCPIYQEDEPIYSLHNYKRDFLVVGMVLLSRPFLFCAFFRQLGPQSSFPSGISALVPFTRNRKTHIHTNLLGGRAALKAQNHPV